MQIAQVAAVFPPYASGTGHVCYHNAVELARLGHDVHVFTASAPGTPATQEMEGITVHRLRPLIQIGNAPLLPQLLWRLRKFDIVHLHFPFISGAELVRLAASLSRTPLIVSFHNDLIGDGARAKVFDAYQRVSAWFTVRHADRLCAVSLDHYEHSLLRDMVGHRGPVAVEVPNGVDTLHFRLRDASRAGTPSGVRDRYNIPDDAGLVLFVASLDRAHHFKGLDRLLKAVKDLPETIWLLIVGDGDLRPGYEVLARELGVARRTVFVGNIPHRETPPFYRTADLTVLPSSPPESFGLVLVESMACGTPVVASNIPGVRTVVTPGQDGYLTTPGDVADLTHKLARMVALPSDQRQAMGLAARRKVERLYAWPRIGERLVEVYEDVLARGPGDAVESSMEAAS